MQCFMRQLARRLNINAAAKFSPTRADLPNWVHIGIADLHSDIFVPAYRTDNSVRVNKP